MHQFKNLEPPPFSDIKESHQLYSSRYIQLREDAHLSAGNILFSESHFSVLYSGLSQMVSDINVIPDLNFLMFPERSSRLLLPEFLERLHFSITVNQCDHVLDIRKHALNIMASLLQRFPDEISPILNDDYFQVLKDIFKDKFSEHAKYVLPGALNLLLTILNLRGISFLKELPYDSFYTCSFITLMSINPIQEDCSSIITLVFNHIIQKVNINDFLENELKSIGFGCVHIFAISLTNIRRARDNHSLLNSLNGLVNFLSNSAFETKYKEFLFSDIKCLFYIFQSSTLEIYKENELKIILNLIELMAMLSFQLAPFFFQGAFYFKNFDFILIRSNLTKDAIKCFKALIINAGPISIPMMCSLSVSNEYEKVSFIDWLISCMKKSEFVVKTEAIHSLSIILSSNDFIMNPIIDISIFIDTEIFDIFSDMLDIHSSSLTENIINIVISIVNYCSRTNKIDEIISIFNLSNFRESIIEAYDYNDSPAHQECFAPLFSSFPNLFHKKDGDSKNSLDDL